MRRKRNSNRPSRSGVAIVEAVMLLPLFIIITMGTIEACSMIFLQQSLEIAAYEGARVAIIPEAEAANVVGGAELQLDGRGVQGYTVTVSPGNPASQPYGTFIRVTVTAPAAANSLFASPLYGSRVFTANVEMMIEH